MNHHHRKTLHALFAHPLSANVDFKKVVHLLEDLGAEVDNKPGNDCEGENNGENEVTAGQRKNATEARQQGKRH